jgi:hypothetical protein
MLWTYAFSPAISAAPRTSSIPAWWAPMVNTCTFTFTPHEGRLASSGAQVDDGAAWPSASSASASRLTAALAGKAGIGLPLLLELAPIQEDIGSLADLAARVPGAPLSVSP